MEIIIYTFLSITLLLVLTDVFSSLLDNSRESVALSEVEIDGKYINQKILNLLPQATTVSLPANLGDSSNTLTFAANGVNYSYYLSDSNLYLSENGIPYRLNSYGTQVTDLAFTKLGNSGGKPVVQTAFNIKSTIIQPKGFEEKSINLTVGTR